MQNVKIRNYVSEKLVSSDRLIDVAGKCHSRIPFYFLNGYAFSPGSVVLLLTYRCNQRCKMCFYHEYYEDIKKREPNNTSKELCLDEIKGLIDDLSDINVPILSLHGGEPTLRKDFIEIINYAKEKCITIRFVTNGINIKNSLARDIVQSQNVDHITFSLHGPESVHDEIVGRTGAYRRLISGIEAITSEIEGDYTKPSISIGCTVSPTNQNHLSHILDVANRLQIEAVTYILMSYSTSEQYDATEVMAKSDRTTEPGSFPFIKSDEMDLQSLKMQKQELKVKSRQYSIKTEFPKDETIENYKDLSFNVNNICFYPWNTGVISPYGDVYPCIGLSFLGLKLGNIREDAFSGIWDSDKYKSFRKKLKSSILPACSKCCAINPNEVL